VARPTGHKHRRHKLTTKNKINQLIIMKEFIISRNEVYFGLRTHSRATILARPQAALSMIADFFWK
jgi:hypothetical protein